MFFKTEDVIKNYCIPSCGGAVVTADKSLMMGWVKKGSRSLRGLRFKVF